MCTGIIHENYKLFVNPLFKTNWFGSANPLRSAFYTCQPTRSHPFLLPILGRCSRCSHPSDLGLGLDLGNAQEAAESGRKRRPTRMRRNAAHFGGMPDALCTLGPAAGERLGRTIHSNRSRSRSPNHDIVDAANCARLAIEGGGRDTRGLRSLPRGLVHCAPAPLALASKQRLQPTNRSLATARGRRPNTPPWTR